MYPCEEIPHSGHYLVTGYPDGGDWLMQPFADYGFNAFQFGCAGAEHIWFINADVCLNCRRKVRLYHAPSRRLVAALVFEHGYAKALASRDGRQLYVFSNARCEKGKPASVVLSVVDVETGAVERVHEGLPSPSLSEVFCQRPDGKILMECSPDGDAIKKRGLCLIDPVTGERQESFVENNSFASTFNCPGPDGRYWLISDTEPAPVKEIQEAGRTNAYRGLTLQVWEAFPLRFVTRLVLTWTPFGETLVDTNGAPFKSIDSIIWQPDGEAFWFRNNGNHLAYDGFVGCAGLDGALSQRLYLQRRQLQRDVRVPFRPDANTFVALPGRRMLVAYSNGFQQMDGAASAIPYGFTPASFAADLPIDATVKGVMFHSMQSSASDLLDRIEALKAAKQGIGIPVKSWSQNGCIDAIDALTAKIKKGFHNKAVDGVIRAVFKIGKSKVEEDVFFADVSAQFPAVSPAIRRLVNRFCDVVPPGAELFWDGEEGIGVFAHAVKALAVLDRESLPSVQRYVLTLDPEHEYFFGQITLPAILEAHDWERDVISFVGSVFLRDLYNSEIDYQDIWTSKGMREAVVGYYDARQFAKRVAHEIGSNEAFRNDKARFGNNVIDEFHDGFEIHEPWLGVFFRKLERRVRVMKRRARALKTTRRIRPA